MTKRDLESLSNDESGVAIYFLRSLIAVCVGGIVWYVGNIVLFDEQVGIATTVENISNATSRVFPNVAGFWEWAWSVFPFVLLLASAIYVIYGGLKEGGIEVR